MGQIRVSQSPELANHRFGRLESRAIGAHMKSTPNEVRQEKESSKGMNTINMLVRRSCSHPQHPCSCRAHRNATLLMEAARSAGLHWDKADAQRLNGVKWKITSHKSSDAGSSGTLGRCVTLLQAH